MAADRADAPNTRNPAVQGAPYTKSLLAHASPQVFPPPPQSEHGQQLTLCKAPPPDDRPPLHWPPSRRLAKNTQTPLVWHKGEVHGKRN